MVLTHAYFHWLGDPDKSPIYRSKQGQTVQLTGFAPANETSRVAVTANANSLGRR